ncbi:MAG TPA: D-alanine--D-alanine ligase family protein [Limnochordia bacterium]
MARKLRVGVIFGGRSGEHEVSLMSAASVLRAIDREKYEIVPIGVSRTGQWLIGGDPLQALSRGTLDELQPAALLPDPGRPVLIPFSGSGGVPSVPSSPLQTLDVIFPLLHGPYGEDGTLQGLLELANIPYVGCGVAASAVGMDKALMKAILREAGLTVLDYLVVLRREVEQDPDAVRRRVESGFGYPCFVKPANLGSSVGVVKVHAAHELEPALRTAAQYDRKLLIEDAAEGCREIECSVLGNDDPIASVPGEVIPSREFYDYEAKYLDTGSQLIIPAPLSPQAAERVRSDAVRAFKAIDGAGMARVDFFVDRKTEAIYVNEVNTIPGFTPISMYPKLWEATGISYSELIDRLIQLALERHRDKERSRTQREA